MAGWLIMMAAPQERPAHILPQGEFNLCATALILKYHPHFHPIPPYPVPFSPNSNTHPPLCASASFTPHADLSFRFSMELTPDHALDLLSRVPVELIKLV